MGDGEGVQMSVDVLSYDLWTFTQVLPCYPVLSHELLMWLPVPRFHFAMKSLKGFFLKCPNKAAPRKGPPASSCFVHGGDGLTGTSLLNRGEGERGNYPAGRCAISKGMKTSLDK